MTDQAFLVNPSANLQRETKTTKAASAYRTISEASDELGVPQHVLRFWETKFSQIRPMKRSGGRRFYRPEDIDLIRTIQTLLYDQGYTIKGVQRLLKMRKGVTTTLQQALDDMGDEGAEEFSAIAPAPITLAPVIEVRMDVKTAVAEAAADVVMNLAEELTELTDDMSPEAAFDLFTNTPLNVLEQIPDHLPAKPARLMATGLAAGHPLPTMLAEELVEQVAAVQPAAEPAPAVAPGISGAQRQELSALLSELKALKALLN